MDTAVDKALHVLGALEVVANGRSLAEVAAEAGAEAYEFVARVPMRSAARRASIASSIVQRVQDPPTAWSSLGPGRRQRQCFIYRMSIAPRFNRFFQFARIAGSCRLVRPPRRSPGFRQPRSQVFRARATA